MMERFFKSLYIARLYKTEGRSDLEGVASEKSTKANRVSFS